VVPQITLLVGRQFKDLTGRPHAIKHLRIGESRIPHCDHFIQSDEAVVVQVRGRRAPRLFGGGGMFLGMSGRLIGRFMILSRDLVAMGAHDVTTGGTQRPANQRSDSAMVTPSNRGPDRGPTRPTNHRALSSFTTWQVGTTGQTDGRQSHQHELKRIVFRDHINLLN